MDHKEMRHNVAEMVEHKALVTIEHIVNEADEHFTCDEIEKIDKCLEAVERIYKTMVYVKQVIPQ